MVELFSVDSRNCLKSRETNFVFKKLKETSCVIDKIKREIVFAPSVFFKLMVGIVKVFFGFFSGISKAVKPISFFSVGNIDRKKAVVSTFNNRCNFLCVHDLIDNDLIII